VYLCECRKKLSPNTPRPESLSMSLKGPSIIRWLGPLFEIRWVRPFPADGKRPSLSESTLTPNGREGNTKRSDAGPKCDRPLQGGRSRGATIPRAAPDRRYGAVAGAVLPLWQV
jgi:hypothetical protein